MRKLILAAFGAAVLATPALAETTVGRITQIDLDRGRLVLDSGDTFDVRFLPNIWQLRPGDEVRVTFDEALGADDAYQVRIVE
jgi:hypothetical protein